MVILLLLLLEGGGLFLVLVSEVDKAGGCILLLLLYMFEGWGMFSDSLEIRVGFFVPRRQQKANDGAPAFQETSSELYRCSRALY
jgi:hypothetical protein